MTVKDIDHQDFDFHVPRDAQRQVTQYVLPREEPRLRTFGQSTLTGSHVSQQRAVETW